MNQWNKEKILKNKAKRKEDFRKKKWSYNPKRRSYTRKYKGEYITIIRSRYGNWGIFFLNHSIWEYNESKLGSFEEAEKAAFAILDENDRFTIQK